MTAHVRLAALASLALLLAPCQQTGSGAPSGAALAAHAPRLFEDLGDHHRDIGSASAQAQRYFDQGLILTYGFNHEGAIESFSEAARLDPDCAICFWGIAYAYGPNINAPMGPEAAAAALVAATRAQELAGATSGANRALIDAIGARYSADPTATRASLDRAFADAMRAAHTSHPDDADIATLFAESLLDLTPWNYWTDDGQPREHTEETLRVLEQVLAREPDHPGANHYLIHALEEFQPERAEAAADRLAKLAPDAGHLVHMPSHIYWRVGRYEDAIRVNQDAAAADVAYFAWCRAPEAYAAGYYNHNLHFLWAAAAARGQRDQALTAARRLASNVPTSAVPTYPFLEDFGAIPVLTLARFGLWDSVLAEPKPHESLRYVTATWHYARGLAYTRKSRLAEARAELEKLEATTSDPQVASVIYDVAGNTAGGRLRVAVHHLRGEIAGAEGDRDGAVASLREAVREQDSANYIEPPAFYFPTRQALGALLLEAGRAEEATEVYRADLKKYPKNGWSLYGLSQSLRKQGKRDEARWAEEGFRNAWSEADVKLAASRF